MKEQKSRARLLKQHGQTSVEYIILISVVVVMLTAIFTQVQNFFLSGDVDCNRNPQAFQCRIESMLPAPGYQNYIEYRFR